MYDRMSVPYTPKKIRVKIEAEVPAASAEGEYLMSCASRSTVHSMWMRVNIIPNQKRWRIPQSAALVAGVTIAEPPSPYHESGFATERTSFLSPDSDYLSAVTIV
ncbi:hypothetical protein DFH28DRAFT_1126603 [Melampsora americana]|nr:hypothetical protein DFH28DRAFT_1126603 [Melampsora americana]